MELTGPIQLSWRGLVPSRSAPGLCPGHPHPQHENTLESLSSGFRNGLRVLALAWLPSATDTAQAQLESLDFLSDIDQVSQTQLANVISSLAGGSVYQAKPDGHVDTSVKDGSGPVLA